MIHANGWSFNLGSIFVMGQGGTSFVCHREPDPVCLEDRSFSPRSEIGGGIWVHELCWMGPWPDG